MIRRVGFFFITNMLVIVTLSIIASVLGLWRYADAAGLDYSRLALLAIFYGFAGSLFSLAISRWAAKVTMGVQVIDPNNPGQFGELVRIVHELASRAQLPAMPEVGVYSSPEVNAFATGPSKKRSLVAVSTGLLQQMKRNEIEGVLAHEVAHIQNGDMVTMTLLQGVVNAFVIFFARVIAYFVGQSIKNDSSRKAAEFTTLIVLEMVLGLLGMIVVNYYSRRREFRADAGSAAISGRTNMINALQRLQSLHGMPVEAQASLAPLKINSGSRGSFLRLFSTHPPLEERIAALQNSSVAG